MRYLLGLLSLIILGGCASVPTAPARTAKQVEPLSEVVIIECDKFKGAIVVLPDGTLEPLTDEKAARAVYDAIGDGHAAIVRTGQLCGPSQST